MVKIYLVRHGEAMGNVLEFFQGRTDAEISSKGKMQLDALAQRFKDINIDVIYSSPLKRTIETAEAVNRYHDVPMILNSDIIEINGGRWEGEKWADLPEKFPHEYHLWKTEINKFQAPDGESTQQVYDRMKAAVNKIAAENQGKSVAVVSHGMSIKAFLTYADGRTWDNYSDPGWSDNTAVSMIEYDDNMNMRLVYKNDSSHLAEGLSTLAVSAWCKDK